ncbi:hypothetical protein ACFWVC_25260 [Streptomyces sp. NPDC058691]|uniref:hypothetical protein n=1 Tax=Streptomyces sp. NPDC058691 TaxID=3346601 RepID=UPI00364A34F5
MRITRTTSALIAAAVCGSLTMGLTGGVASAHAPVRITAVHLAPAADAAETGRADLIAKLGDTLSIGAKLTQEAQAQAPDSAKLEELRQGLEEATQQLSTVVGQAAGAADPSQTYQSGIDPAAQFPAGPATDPQFADVALPADSSERAADPVSDVQKQLDTLVADVAALLKAALAKDLAGVTAGVTRVVADLQALLLSVPKLLTGALPLPITLPLDDQSALDPQAPEALAPQDPAAAPQAPEMPVAPFSQVQ